MDLDEIVTKKNVEFLRQENLINENDILKIENEINVKLGTQLKKYILKYGYIGYKHIEFLRNK